MADKVLVNSHYTQGLSCALLRAALCLPLGVAMLLNSLSADNMQLSAAMTTQHIVLQTFNDMWHLL